jgi:hypothetical protein
LISVIAEDRWHDASFRLLGSLRDCPGRQALLDSFLLKRSALIRRVLFVLTLFCVFALMVPFAKISLIGVQ